MLQELSGPEITIKSSTGQTLSVKPSKAPRLLYAVQVGVLIVEIVRLVVR